MIYLLDEPKTDTSHSRFMECIISEHTAEQVLLIELSSSSTVGDIKRILIDLINTVRHTDIVFCPWVIPGNAKIDDLFDQLSDRCWVVAAAGNNNEPTDSWTPARANGSIVVGSLNKSGEKASLSNYSNIKRLEWVPGTNYSVGWKTGSGTSVSSALYAAFLAESIRERDYSLISKLIEGQKRKVLQELNS